MIGWLCREGKTLAQVYFAPVMWVWRRRRLGSVYWKHDYLELTDRIERFEAKYLHGLTDYRPPFDDPAQGNVARLLRHHLDRSKELLRAEVNGGLDEQYQKEIDALCGPDSSAPSR